MDEVPVWFKGNITFEANDGSALSVIGTMVNFTHCRAFFSRNHGNKGGAIALLGSAYMQVSNGTWLAFEHNSALSLGGAIYNTYISRENLKSDSSCFIRHTNPFLHPDDWNATFIFAFNTDLGGNNRNAIHSTSILPCMVPGGSGSTNSTSQIFCWKNWIYTNQFFHCNAEVTSDIGDIILTSQTVRVYPGWIFSLPIILEDDMEHAIGDTLFEVTYNDSNNINVYRGTKAVVYGQPGDTVELSVTSVGNRIWHFNLIVELKPCPAGFTGKESQGLTICACSHPRSTILCDDISHTLQLPNGLWIGELGQESVEVVMDCPTEFCEETGNKYIKATYSNDPDESVDWDAMICGPTNRTGINCGECIPGYGPAVNSLAFKSVNCTDINLAANIAKYIAAVYIPLTVLFMVLILFDIRLTTGPANAFILYCQIIANGNSNGELTYISQKWYAIFPFGVLNLRLFESYISPICFSTKFNVLTLFLLDYVVAIFPLLMIVFVVIFFKVCENCCLRNQHLSVRYKWCLLSLSRLISALSRGDAQKGISDALLPAFASFLLLSYTKFSQTSFYILDKLSGFDETLSAPRFFYASQIHYNDSLYIIPAALVLGTFITLTPLILLHYPLKALEWCILKVNWLRKVYPMDKVHLFLDMFQGCYRNKMRFFAGLYFLYRFVVNVSYALSENYPQQLLIQQTATMVMILLLVLCQPYKWSLLNYVDIFAFINLATINSISFYIYSFTTIYPDKELRTSVKIFQYTLAFLPLVYMSAYILWKVTHPYYPMIKSLKWPAVRPVVRRVSQQLDEGIFARAKDRNTYALSSQGEGDDTNATDETLLLTQSNNCVTTY